MDESDDDAFEVKEDGSELTFDMPGGVSGDVEVAVVSRFQGASKDNNKTDNITVNPSSLELSLTEVAPNASVIISGSGFNEGKMIAVEDITIDDERPGGGRCRHGVLQHRHQQEW